MATDAGTSSQSSTTRKVLVRVGANSRVVTLDSDANVNAAIVGAFSDVPRVHDLRTCYFLAKMFMFLSNPLCRDKWWAGDLTEKQCPI